VRIALAVTAVALVLVLGGGSLAWAFERDEPGSNLHSLGDCVWWAMTTLTTVGYGDHYPVSAAGRVVAAGVMVGGVAILGGVAASIALVVTQRLFARAAQMEEEVAEVEEELAESVRETESLEQLIRELLDRVSGLEEQVRALRVDRHRGGDDPRGAGPDGADPSAAAPTG
jgi:voltage-gated potassium channel